MTTRRTDASAPEIQALIRSGSFAGLSDGDLLERCRRRDDPGSDEAFAALVERHGPMVLRTCRTVLADPHDAEDAFQVTFLVLARKAGTIRRHASVAGWLHGVACRTSAYARGTFARRRKHERTAAARVGEAVEPEGPDDSAAVLQEEIGRLPERLRAAVLLCELEGLSGEDAAGRLGCPVGTVKSRLARARERLRRRLTLRGLDTAFVIPPTAGVPASLADKTVASASGMAAGGAGRFITAALAAWEKGVLRAMLMTKLRIAATLVAVGLLSVGTALVASGQVTTKPKAAAPAPSKTEDGVSPDQLLALLARARIEAARQIRDDQFRLYQGGEATLTAYHQALQRYQEACLEAFEDPGTRIKILRQNLNGFKTIEEHTKELQQKGQATRADVKTAEFYRLDAAIRLTEAESGMRASLHTPLPPGMKEASNVEALFDRYEDRQTAEEIRALLKKPVTLEFPNPTTLGDVLRTLKLEGNGPFDNELPIYVEPEALKRIGLGLESRITVARQSGALGDVFQRVLDPLGLKYVLRQGLLWISAKAPK